MPNRLASESSPYLLQHKDNPVDWYPWGPEALARAKREDKPIFLSVGYAACHWCHVMEHESFEDEQTAAIMNEHFVNIKVDREERPDLDNIYMKSVVALTGQGGWPMSVFLTPDGQPFYGGTYFPPVPRYNMPAFRQVLLRMSELWRTERERIEDIGADLLRHLQAEFSGLAAQSERLEGQVLDQAALALAQHYDWTRGGWGPAPKFPQPMALGFLAQRASRGDGMARDLIEHTLNAMARGGIYDVIGGGFHRYSVDDRWLVPHFEKMLYDNAQLSLAYLQGYLLFGAEHHRSVCEETIDFVLREMRHPDGGFYSSLDADSEGEEGLFYVWTPLELREALLDEADIELFFQAYGITEGGNFEGRNVLQRQKTNSELAKALGRDPDAIEGRLQVLHRNMLEVRAQRTRPATDDKVLTSWNGLMLGAISEAGRHLDRPDYLRAAADNAGFLLENLRPDGRLLRSWRAGNASHNAYLEDHAALCLGLLSLYMSQPDPKWFTAARELADEMVRHYWVEGEGFYDTRHDHESLVVRPRDSQDNATPSGGALAAHALLRISALDGRGDWRDVAEEALKAMQGFLPRYPTAFSHWLMALDFALADVQEIAVLGDPSDDRWLDLQRAVWDTYRPYRLLAADGYPPDERSPALLRDRPLLDRQPTAFVCRQFVCRQPVNRVEDLQAQLGDKTDGSVDD